MFKETQIHLDGMWLNVMSGPESGPPLVLLHGVTRRWQTFMPILPALSSRWHVQAVDFPGHGASSPHPGWYHVADYVAAAKTFLEGRFAEPAVVYGHSLGSMVAAGLAAELPGAVRAIVMEDPPLDTMGSRIRESFLHEYFVELQALAGSARPLDDVAKDLAEISLTDPSSGASQRLGDTRDATALRFTASCLARFDSQALAPVIAGEWLKGFDWLAVFEQIDCPALLIQADAAVGGMLTEADAQRTIAALKQCTHVKLKGIGHLVHGTRPAELLTMVTAFLESL